MSLKPETMNKIKGIYEELQGYLQQAPSVEKGFHQSNPDTKSIGVIFNNVIGILSKLDAENDFSRFNVKVERIPEGYKYVEIPEYRAKVHGLINYMHACYFSSKAMPFGGTPATIMQQSNSNSIQISIILDMQAKLVEKLTKGDISEDERGFLSKLKDSLASVTNIVQLIQIILQLATQYGFDIHTITKLLA